MPRPMTGVIALIASPDDAGEERALLRDKLIAWTVTHGRREGVAVIPWLWERHPVTVVGGRPQALLNEQAVDQADVVIAFFDRRLGTETSVDVYGTAEQITRAADAGVPVHVYFSAEPWPQDADPEQIRSLRAFEAEMEKRGAMGTYTDSTHLAAQVARAIEADIEDSGWSQLSAGPLQIAAGGADLRFTHVHEREARGFDKRGRMQYRSVSNDLVVQNAGSVPAEDLTFTVEPVGGTQFAFPDPPVAPFTLPPHSEMSWLLISTPMWGSSGNTVRIVAKWREGDEQREVVRTVTLRGA